MEKNNDYISPDELDNKEVDSIKDAENNDGENLTNEDIMSEVSDALEDLQYKYDELNNNYLRLHAEFDNFRKRTLKEKADLIKSGGQKILTDILPFADDFERALQSLHLASDKNAVVEGMDLIYSKFLDFLSQHGVKEIEAIGKPFDAELFEAITTIPTQDQSQKGIVIDCIQKGYYLNDKIIRFPKVIVGE